MEPRIRLSSDWIRKASWLGALAAVASTATAQASDQVVKSGTQQSIRDLNFISPAADDGLRAENGVVLSGDFDGDGQIETAFRDSGSRLWRTSDGERIRDEAPFFFPATQTEVVGDFDGDGDDDLAWRLNGCPFWVVDRLGQEPQIIFDQIYWIETPQLDVQVGDFNGDGADEIAWRYDTWPGWVVNGTVVPVSVMLDWRTDFVRGDQSTVVVDLDGDGVEEVAWRRTGSTEWVLNNQLVPLSSLDDGRSDFDPTSAGQIVQVGDFDGDDRGDIAWRKTGETSWHVNSDDGVWTITDGDSSFDPSEQADVVGDFDCDGADDLGRRGPEEIEWRINSASDPLWTLQSSTQHYFDPTTPIHVGDFDGDCTDDIAWMTGNALDWQVDSLPGNFEESTLAPSFAFEFVYADIDGDGEADDYVLAVEAPDGSATIVYQPLTIAYLLSVNNISIDPLWFESLSPEQQQSLYENAQGTSLAAGFEKVDPAGPNTSPNVTLIKASFNANLDDINELNVEAAFTAVEIEDIQIGEATGSVKILDASAMVIATGGIGGAVDFKVAEGSINYGAFTGTVTVGSAEAAAYVNDGGFALKAGVTVIAAEASLGDTEGSHVTAGLGFGVGGGVSGKWGDNDQYGAEIDIKFVKFGVYLKGSDVEDAFEPAVDWIAGAANDTADWTVGAWEDTKDWFEQAGQDTGEAFVNFFDDTEDFFVDMGSTIEDGFVQFGKDTETAFVEFGNDVETVVDDIGDSVGDFVDTMENTGKAIGSFFGKLF